MFNPNPTPTQTISDAIVRIDQCGVGVSVVFSDKAALDSYVAHVQGVAERRFPLATGGYLQGESEEQMRDEHGKLVFQQEYVSDGEDSGDYVEIPLMVTYPWLRLR